MPNNIGSMSGSNQAGVVFNYATLNVLSSPTNHVSQYTPSTMEDLFSQWMATQTSGRGGSVYTQQTITDYCTALRDWLRDNAFAALSTKNVFKYNELAEYVIFKGEVESLAGYNAFNNSVVHGPGRLHAAMEKYKDFLQDVNVQSVIKMMKLVAPYLASIRTKPFVLLAGISGTGKSRLVRQLARGCCPSGHDLGKDAEGHADAAQKPGNYEIIPVRPNWHDSTELMGYVTRITASNKPEFVIKPFVRFIAKAMVYKDVPFFLCLDEMNLAPVEQYFAEFLSAVETRKKTSNGIVSDVLVNFDLPEIDVKATVNALMKDWIDVTADGTVTEKVPNAKAVYEAIVADKGLRIPPNLLVMGTVNMDETTCSFSRKVLDRAMTFELNEVDMDEGLASDNSIPYGSIPADQAFATDVEGCDFYPANKDLCDKVKTYLLSVNAVLEDTPFKFAYRSRNEIMLYCIERARGGVVSLARALDEATSMKILSRIEGDDQKLLYVGDNPAYKDKTILEALKGEIAAALKVVNGGTDPVDCTVCAKKLDFMARRLDGGFTNFFV